MSKKISLVTFTNAQILDVTGPLEVFSMANDFLMKNGNHINPPYEIEILSLKKGVVKMSSGIKIIADRSYLSKKEKIDTLLVSGGSGAYKARENKELIQFIKEEKNRARRIASICSGTFLLAEAGLLKGMKVTTHWSVSQRLSREYPDVKTEPDKIFIKNGKIYTSGGVTAGIDLALSMVEEDYDRKTALYIAKMLVIFIKRQGGQSQFSSHLAAQTESKGQLKDLPQWIINNTSKDLSITALANYSAMSERNFSRIFKKEMGMTPAKFVELARIDYASQKLEIENIGLDEVAEKSGFGSSEKMRRTFKKHLNILPVVYRQRFGGN